MYGSSSSSAIVGGLVRHEWSITGGIGSADWIATRWDSVLKAFVFEAGEAGNGVMA